jgi:hypothetical protein
MKKHLFNTGKTSSKADGSGGTIAPGEITSWHEGKILCHDQRRQVLVGKLSRGASVMKKTLLFLLLTVPLLMTSSLQAVSYPPSSMEPTYLKDEEVMKVGSKLHMFHSGTQDVKSAIVVHDVLTVYREYPPDISGATKETGKVRVTATLGDYYFEAEVIEGYVQPGSIALKGTVACLITTRLKARR